MVNRDHFKPDGKYKCKRCFGVSLGEYILAASENYECIHGIEKLPIFASCPTCGRRLHMGGFSEIVTTDKPKFKGAGSW